MADTEQTQDSQTNFVPHIAAAVLVVILILALVFWPSEQEPETPQPVQVELPKPEPEPVVEPEPEITLEPEQEPEPKPEVTPEPEPALDLSDAAVKTAIMALSTFPEVGHLLVNDDLLRRFVVFTDNLTREELAANFHPLSIPEKPFRIYQQAGKEWIDAASFKRYTPYVETLDSMDAAQLVGLYDTYREAIDEIYAEIGYPDENFDEVVMDAIEHLLDTPEIPVPVEVFSESVMYKFRDDRIESLSPPQKQLLRTGPENMRQIKAKLREIRAILDDRQS